MKYIKGHNRNQLVLFPTSLDAVIEQDNDVRFIDLFVESLDIAEMNFNIGHSENGRPAYHPRRAAPNISLNYTSTAILTVFVIQEN